MIKNTLLIAALTIVYGVHASENDSQQNFQKLQKIIESCKEQQKFVKLSDATIAIDTTEYQAQSIYQTNYDKYTIELLKINSRPRELFNNIHATDMHQLERFVANEPGRNYMIKVSDTQGNKHKGYFIKQPNDDQSNKYINIAIQIIKTKNKQNKNYEK